MVKSASILFVSALILAGSIAVAGDSAVVGAAPRTETLVGDPQPTYGTATQTSFIIPSSAFTPDFSTTTYSSTGPIDRYVTTVGAALVAGAMLPNGAQIEIIALRACDNEPSADVSADLVSCPSPGICVGAGTVRTLMVPGCNDFFTTLTTPLVVNNRYPIYVQVHTGTTATTTFSAVKLYYRLQISPSPATATFPNDVPTTHPFFRFVEALASAGVTGGCGAGAYCPDAPVTRGQMAVFLSTALGLHFPF